MTTAAPLRVLSIATLFPDAARPNFGLFVERSLGALAAQPGIDLTIVAPVGLPPFPLSLHGRYRALRSLPPSEEWRGLTVRRPRFPLIPRYGARFNAALVARAVLSAVEGRTFDVIDAQFFYPDGPAAMHVAAALDLPFSVKARGADISHFGHDGATAPQLVQAADQAAGLLAVSESMRRDMAAIGIDPANVTIHYTGIDAGRFHPGDRAAARAALGMGDELAIATVGALIPRKGQALVIEALPALPALAPSPLSQAPRPAADRKLERPHRPSPALSADPAHRRALKPGAGCARRAVGGAQPDLRRCRRAILLPRRSRRDARCRRARPPLLRQGTRGRHQSFRA